MIYFLWKEILEHYLKDFTDYCFPDLSQLIDWAKPIISLDQELLAISRRHLTGKCLLDKLFQVFLKDSKKNEDTALLHIEVQAQAIKKFSDRVFIYHYRLQDRYKKPVISCVILVDKRKKWRPNLYEYNFGGTRLYFEFSIVKLLDYDGRETELIESNNLFASVILIQLAAWSMKRRSPCEHKEIKLALTKRLYDGKFSKKDIVCLYNFIDWMICLEPELEIEYYYDLLELEKGKNMAYVSWIEKHGIEKGIAQAKLDIAKNLSQAGASSELILKATGISLEKINPPTVQNVALTNR